MTVNQAEQRRVLDRTQAIAVVVWLAFGGAVLYFGWHLAMFNRRGGPGPGFFLKSLAILLLVLAAARGLTLLRASMPTRPAERDAALPAEPYEIGNIARFVLLVLALTVYAYLLPVLGFLVATTALGWASLVLLGERPLRAFLEAAVAAFLVRLAFTHGLGVPLPEASFALFTRFGL